MRLVAVPFPHPTNLEKGGVRPKVAQTLARHSDIRLTMNVYTHAELADQTAAIEAMAGPPSGDNEDGPEFGLVG